MAGCLAGCGSDAAQDTTTAPEAAESTDAAETAEPEAAAEETDGDEITLTFWSCHTFFVFLPFRESLA